MPSYIMPTELNFVKHQDRSFFNIHKPIEPAYYDVWEKRNERNAPLPQEEALRQEGSGKFSTMPVQKTYGRGLPPQANNYDPSIKAPINRVYEYANTNQFHSPVQDKLHLAQHGGSITYQRSAPIIGPMPYDRKTKLMHGGGLQQHRHHGGANGIGNPAINNWKVGTRIQEPMRIYEYSTASQVHSKPVDPIVYPARQAKAYIGHLSYDDFKPFSQTSKYIDSVRHVQNNPLIIKG